MHAAAFLYVVDSLVLDRLAPGHRTQTRRTTCATGVAVPVPCLRTCPGPATARLSFSEDEASMCIHMIKARGVAPARHSWSRARRRRPGGRPGGVRRTISSILQPRVGSYVLRIIFLCDTLALSSWYCSSASWRSCGLSPRAAFTLILKPSLQRRSMIVTWHPLSHTAILCCELRAASS